MTTPQTIRQLNEARALTALFREGGMSRADLARNLALTRSTTGNLVQSLIEAGLLRERGEDAPDWAARVGRPGIMVEIERSGAYFVGADIGVERITGLAIDLATEVRHEVVRRFDGAGCKPDLAAQETASVIAEVMAALPVGAPVRGACVAIPGFHAADGGFNAPNLGWTDAPIGEHLQAAVGPGLPVRVENDANANAFAETYRSRDADADVLVILIERGVGCGIVSGGRLHRGALRAAGEVGHIRIGDEGYVHDTRRPGRLESYIGKDALEARWHYYGGRGPLEALLDDLAADVPAARRAATDWGYWLGRGISALASTLGPQKVVLSGSVSTVYRFVDAAVTRQLRSALPEGFPVPLVETSQFSGVGPALGAAYLLHQAMLSADGGFAA